MAKTPPRGNVRRVFLDFLRWVKGLALLDLQNGFYAIEMVFQNLDSQIWLK